MGTAQMEYTQEEIDAMALAHLKKCIRQQARHSARMKKRREVQRERKKAILQKGDDVVLCLDCRNGSPQIHSAELVIEQKPRHPIVERRDARATGRLVIDHRPNTWTRFGSPVPTQKLPVTLNIGFHDGTDHGMQKTVILNEVIEEEIEEGPTIVPLHYGDKPSSCREELEARLAMIDPRYHGVEPATIRVKNRKGEWKETRNIPWTM